MPVQVSEWKSLTQATNEQEDYTSTTERAQSESLGTRPNPCAESRTRTRTRRERATKRLSKRSTPAPSLLIQVWSEGGSGVAIVA